MEDTNLVDQLFLFQKKPLKDLWLIITNQSTVKAAGDPVGVSHVVVSSDDPLRLHELPVETVLKGFIELMNKLKSEKITPDKHMLQETD